MNENALHVAYSADDNYAKYLGISMLSLLERNRAFEKITVAVLDCGIGPENRARLCEIAGRYGREISFYPMSNVRERLMLSGRTLTISVASYARLFLASVLPFERVLYIDCDTVVAAPLLDLWRTQMGDALVAGVEDTVDAYFRKVIGLPAGEKYINAGVLLINLGAWRQEGIEDQFMAFIRRFDGAVPHHDQGTINGVCGLRRKVLPFRYNVMSNAYSFPSKTIQGMYALNSYYPQEEMDAAFADPAIVHFTSGLLGRPWEEGCTHPAQALFLDALAKSPWRGDPMLPCSMKKSTELFARFYHLAPKALFVSAYRILAWAVHPKG